MSVNLFLEKTDFLTTGAYFFDPQHCISSLKQVETIDAVYFPYMINGGFLNDKMKVVVYQHRMYVKCM